MYQLNVVRFFAASAGLEALQRAARPNPAIAHGAEKRIPFSARDDAGPHKVSIGWIPRVESTLGSDALVSLADHSGEQDRRGRRPARRSSAQMLRSAAQHGTRNCPVRCSPDNEPEIGHASRRSTLADRHPAADYSDPILPRLSELNRIDSGGLKKRPRGRPLRYSAAATRGRPREWRSRLISSAVRKAISRACSALRRGSQ